MQIETVSISSLIPDPSNVRLHPDKNLAAIKGSLAKFAQQKPIVVDKNNLVIAGNGTLEAAKLLGWNEIKIIRTELIGAQATAFAIADNRTSELAEWDRENLGAQLQALYEDGFGIEDIGFDLGEINFDSIEEHELDDKQDIDLDKKYLLEIEFSDEQALNDEYEQLLSKGLIVRVKK